MIQTLQKDRMMTKEENTKYKTSLSEYQKQCEDFKNSSSSRLSARKQDLENERQKNDFSMEEIKNCRANISRLETQINEEQKNNKKLLEEQKSMKEKPQLRENDEEKLRQKFKNLATIENNQEKRRMK